MEGLLTQGGGAPQPAQGQAGEVAATPEEEAVMEQALSEVGKMIYASDSAADALLETIASSEKPEAGIGIVVSQVVGVVDQKMDLPDDYIAPLSEAVTMMVVEMADKAGIIEASDDVIELAMMETAKNIAQDYEVDPQAMSGAMQDEQIAPEVERIGGRYAGQS